MNHSCPQTATHRWVLREYTASFALCLPPNLAVGVTLAVLLNNDTVTEEAKAGGLLCLRPQHANHNNSTVGWTTFRLSYTEHNLGSLPVESPWTNHWFWDGALLAVDQR
jgi:hypothetical protein